MLENTPFLSRIHTEKSLPPPACWTKVLASFCFSYLLRIPKHVNASKTSFVWAVSHGSSASIFTEQYEAYMKQHDVTYKSEVTTTVVQEPSVVVSQYELEQRQVTTPMSFVSEKVHSPWTSIVLQFQDDGIVSRLMLNITFFFCCCRNFSFQPLKRGSSRRLSFVSWESPTESWW